jgi:hypothetical protein
MLNFEGVLMKRFMMILAGAMLALGIARAPAQATTFNLGTLTDGTPVFQGDLFSRGTFSDTINFTLSTASAISGAVWDLAVLPLSNLSNLKISIDGTSLALNAGHGGAYTGAVLASLAAGDHSFTITGRANGLVGGAYLFKVAATAVAATPIPPALLMFGTALAGLGVAGWRRRKAMAV